jgi:hypothetical protein
MPETPATQEAEIRRIVVPGQPRQKVRSPYLNKNLGMVAHACNLNYVGGVGKKRIASRMA